MSRFGRRRGQGGATIVNARFAVPEGQPSAGRFVARIAVSGVATLAAMSLALLLAINAG